MSKESNETKTIGIKMKTKTVEMTRWAYLASDGTYYSTFGNKEYAISYLAKCDPNAILVELKGSYEIEVPDRTITITESELIAKLTKSSNSYIRKWKQAIFCELFGGDE